MLTPEQLAELRRLHQAATRAPWHRSGDDVATAPVKFDSGVLCADFPIANFEFSADLDLVVGLRNVLPQVLDAAEVGIGVRGKVIEAEEER